MNDRFTADVKRQTKQTLRLLILTRLGLRELP